MTPSAGVGGASLASSFTESVSTESKIVPSLGPSMMSHTCTASSVVENQCGKFRTLHSILLGDKSPQGQVSIAGLL